MPRITVEGGEFRRLGVEYKLWGYEQYDFNFTQEFFDSTGAPEEPHDYRAVMADNFRGDRRQGGNMRRIRLEMWRMMEGPDKNNLSMKASQMENFIFMLDQARKYNTYILLTLCNVTRPTEAPAWYDDVSMTNQDRWDVQEFMCREIVKAVVNAGHSTTIFAYDLINEPSITTDPDAYWYGPSFLGSDLHFVPLIAKGPGVDGTTVRAWITQLRDAIKEEDNKSLVTVGFLPFDTGATGVSNTEDLLDFNCPHLYPAGGLFGAATPEDEAQHLAWIQGWIDGATKPLVNGETQTWGTQEHNDACFGLMTASFKGLTAFSFGYGPLEQAPPPAPPKYPANPEDSPEFHALIMELWVGGFNSYQDAFFT